jgi:hypothetical protein
LNHPGPWVLAYGPLSHERRFHLDPPSKRVNTHGLTPEELAEDYLRFKGFRTLKLPRKDGIYELTPVVLNGFLIDNLVDHDKSG